MLASPPVSVYFSKNSALKKSLTAQKMRLMECKEDAVLPFCVDERFTLKMTQLNFFHWSIFFFDASLVLIIAIKHANR